MNTYKDISVTEFRNLLRQCNGKRISLDTETTGLEWWSDKLTTVGFFCPDADVCGTIEILENWTEELQAEVRKAIREELQAGTTVIMHNAKFDCHFMDISPWHQGWRIIDTTVLVHLIDSRIKKNMANVEGIFLGTRSKREHVDAAPARKKIWEWDKDLRQDYCVNDCRVTYQLAEELYPRIRDLGMTKLFSKEMKYLGVLYNIERHGHETNPAFIKEAGIALEKHQKNLEEQLFDACGTKFNWRSPKQLSAAIYEGLGISKPINPFLSADGKDHTKFVDRGMYNATCTSTFILMEKAHHPLGELISSLREASKLRKTLKNFISLADNNDTVHTNFNLTGTRTGRLSSSKPNLQNVPSDMRSRFTSGVFTGGSIRTEEFNLRNSLVAGEGMAMLSIDWKQMEMRMFGILSQDELMLGALRTGADIHLWIAKQVWGDCGEDDNKLHREWSKTITFGLVYGMTTGGLQFKLEMTRAEAQQVSEDYWNKFPRIRPWMFEVIDECRQNGFVRYWSNRIWKEEDPNMFYRSANALIQGGCADLLSIAVIRVQQWLDSKGAGWGAIVNLVHDEIIVVIPKDELNQAAIEMSKIMEVEDLFNMPFLVDCKAGTTYGNLEKFVPTGDINGH